ncbi:MAG: hypothetical protein WCA30_13125 [Dermatophilaceae bacterium]
MERTGADVDAFLDGLPEPRRHELRTLDALIVERLGGRERELWEGTFWSGTEQQIIGYARIEQSRPKGQPVEWFLIGLAVQKQHISVYVNAAGDGGYLTKAFADRLGRVKVGAASVTFTSLDRLDLVGFGALLDAALDTLD